MHKHKALLITALVCLGTIYAVLKFFPSVLGANYNGTNATSP